MKMICKIISIFLVVYSSLFSKEIKIDNILKKIENFKKEHKAASKIVLKYDPFFPKLKKERRKKDIKQIIYKKSYKLKAILNEKAFINQKWYKIGDIIDSYKIDKIGSDKVLLVKGKKSKILSLASGKKLLKIKDNTI